MTRTACLNAIYDLAKRDERVIFIGSDLSPNTMLDFKRDFPKRFLMEGIQEQNIVGMAAGLAKEGFIPYVNTIAPFLARRAYEQIAMDVCLPNLPVRFIANGGGLVYAPLGPTHCCIEDIALMRALPNMTVVNCAGSEEMRDMMDMSLGYDGPMYFRLGKDSDQDFYFTKRTHSLELVPNILIVSTGMMSSHIAGFADELNAKVLHLPIIKPFQHVTFLEQLGSPKLIVALEEGIISGGLGSAVLECLADNNIQLPVLRLGLPDAFPHHYGEQEDLFETYGLTPEKIAARIKEAYERLSH